MSLTLDHAPAEAGDGGMDPEELRDAARRLLQDRVDRRGAWTAGGGPAGVALFAEMAAQGWTLLTLPEAEGGLGQSFSALAPIYEELGRALAPSPLAWTLAAAEALVDPGLAGGRDLLTRIAAGEARVAVAFAAAPPLASQPLTDIVGAPEATDLLVLPPEGSEAAWVVGLAGAEVRSVETWDRTRSLGVVCGGDAVALAQGDVARSLAAAARAHLDLAVAWDSIGAGQQALDEAVAYMCTRQQFNRPIASFQALKHRSADLKVALEIARALTQTATHAFAARQDGWADLAAQAKLLAADAFRAIAEESVQFHGGIGFTWEHDCHLFLKRALMNEMIGGSPEQYRDRIAPGAFRRALATRVG